ncbi:MAG: hypothetical protein ACREBB_01765 [Nitrosotalea sp.]
MTEESLLSHQILEIGKNQLPQDKFDEALVLVKESLDDKNLENVAEKLWSLVNYRIPISDMTAKQLLDYVAYDLRAKLDPWRMRGICQSAIQSVEVICKLIWKETRNNPDLSFFDPPFGPVIRNLKDQEIIELKTVNDLDHLVKYARNPGTHTIKMNYSGRKHFYSIQDTIMILYIVAALTRKLIPLIIYDYEWKCLDKDWKNIDETEHKLE